ncbi:MAG: allantoinase AllB [Planctomycetota bacterium]
MSRPMPDGADPPTEPPLSIRSPRIVTPAGEVAGTVRVADGRIAAIDAHPVSPAAADAPVLLPGMIDVHVHLNEPGRTDWEGFATGTAAAAAGGVTTLVDMPLNSSPVTTGVAALQAKRAAASAAGLSADVAFYGGLVPGNAAELPALLEAGVVGVKCFLCDSGLDEFPAATEADLRAAMPLLAERGVPLLAHAEIVGPAPAIADHRSAVAYAATRPPDFERRAIELLIRLCRDTGCRTHVVHLADAGSVPTLAEARAEGLPITVETCPHYLTFDVESVPDGATEFKCAPPIRDAANREALWRGLAEGVIDFVASDHSPCPPLMKDPEEGRFDRAWGGISSVQLSLSVLWTEASRRGHSLARVADWLAHWPATLVGVEAGVRVGAPANLVAFDPAAAWTVDPAELRHRHPVTPYSGRELRGVVQQTWVRGEPAAPGVGRALP